MRRSSWSNELSDELAAQQPWPTFWHPHAKATGLRNLPCHQFAANDAWLTLVMIAQTLVCWTQALCLSGELACAEHATLRYRLWHTAGRLVRHGRQLILRLQRTWPWAGDLVTAFGRLRALPARC